jgi:hypothetical protein
LEQYCLLLKYSNQNCYEQAYYAAYALLDSPSRFSSGPAFGQKRTVIGLLGTVKDGVIEVQGDHCEQVVEELKKHGHNANRVGG